MYLPTFCFYFFLIYSMCKSCFHFFLSFSLLKRVFYGMLLMGSLISVIVRNSISFSPHSDLSLLKWVPDIIVLLHFLCVAVMNMIASRYDIRKEVIAQKPWILRTTVIVMYICFIIGCYTYITLKQDDVSVKFFKTLMRFDDILFVVCLITMSIILLMLIEQEIPAEKRTYWRVSIICITILAMSVVLSFLLQADIVLRILSSTWMRESFFFLSCSICGWIAGLEREIDNIQVTQQILLESEAVAV